MEKYPMFLGGKNQYYENYYTTKCNIKIQGKPYQSTNNIFFTELQETISLSVWKHKKP